MKGKTFLEKEKREFSDLENIERGIITRFRRTIYRKFCKALDDYELIKDGDKIAICISGGKDSFLLAKCMQEIQKHGDKKFELEFICMNPGYLEEVANTIKKTGERLGINVKFFKNQIFKIAGLQNKGACYLCAKMRRGALYEIAENLGCNKIALGHHFTDVTTTILMNILYGSEYKTMMPKLKSDNFKGMELIRPLYYVEENDIERWRDTYNLEFIHCACPISDYKIAKHTENLSKRDEVKKLIQKLKITNPAVEKRIFKTSENINLDASIGWKYKGKKHSFLDEY